MNYVDTSQEAPAYEEESSGPKKAIIIGSVVVVVIGLIVSGLLIYRSRVLQNTALPGGGVPTDGLGITEPDGKGDGGSISLPPVISDDTPAPAEIPCGDGICQEAEICPADCGDALDKFRSKISYRDVTPTSLTVTWVTDTPSTGVLEYGETERFELGTKSSSEPLLIHSVQLTGLSEGVNYLVKLKVTEENGNVYEIDDLVFETF